MKIGSLFSGYSGLDMAVVNVLGGEVVWHCEFDKNPSAILAHHYPHIPNLGDVTKVDWSGVEPVDVLTGGFPCQDLSHAGKRKGLRDGTRSGLWAYMFQAIEELQPKLVVIENVLGILSASAAGEVESCPWCVGDEPGEHLRALGVVCGDLAQIGYDARWVTVRAADAGACHGRARVFIVARPSGTGFEWSTPSESGVEALALLPTPNTMDGMGARSDEALARAKEKGGCSNLKDVIPRLGDHLSGSGIVSAESVTSAEPVDFGPYVAAVRRWELVMGRPAPSPTEPDGEGEQRLNAAFVEWMMGLPEGWVCDPAIGLSRTAQLRCLGNGVVPQQAELALRMLLGLPAAAVGGDPDLIGTPTAGLGAGGGRRSHVFDPVSSSQRKPNPVELIDLLPTPVAQMGGPSGEGNGVPFAPNLRQVAEQLLSTPRATRGGSATETTELLLPTPAVNDMGNGKTPPQWDAWTEAMKQKHGNGNGHGKSLAIEAQRLTDSCAQPQEAAVNNVPDEQTPTRRGLAAHTRNHPSDPAGDTQEEGEK